MTTGQPPWERRGDESGPAWAAVQLYRDDPDRSLRTVGLRHAAACRMVQQKALLRLAQLDPADLPPFGEAHVYTQRVVEDFYEHRAEVESVLRGAGRIP